MDAREYVNVVGRAARALARLELRRTKLRRQLRQLDADIRAAKRNLRLVAQAVEPYDPPEPRPDPDD